MRLGFSGDRWIEHCLKKRKLEGGGFAKPKPPLFPGENGRHRQRAFRDALTDILPSEHGFAPTLRLADSEIRDWVLGPGATDRMTALIAERLCPPDDALPILPSGNEFGPDVPLSAFPAGRSPPFPSCPRPPVD